MPRIALAAPLVAPITAGGPPLGGAQALLADLARALAGRGHEVVLLAPRGSRVPGVRTPLLDLATDDLRPARFEPGGERTDAAAQDAAFASVAAWLAQHRACVDVVHGHAYDAPAFRRLADPRLPVVHTLHLPPLEDAVAAAVRQVAETTRLVAVSRHAARLWQTAGVEISDVVPNGVDVASIPFGERGRGYALFAGRMTPEKGPDVAIAAAERAGIPLLLVGGAYDPAFFQERVQPRVRDGRAWTAGEPIRPGATHLGHRSRAEVVALMAEADVTLVPARWEEPFGLVAAEAQAAGSPVVAFRRGALPEVVADGETGVLVPADDVSGLVEAIGAARSLSRAACRARAEEHLSLERMVNGYEAVYARALEERSD